MFEYTATIFIFIFNLEMTFLLCHNGVILYKSNTLCNRQKYELQHLSCQILLYSLKETHFISLAFSLRAGLMGVPLVRSGVSNII